MCKNKNRAWPTNSIWLALISWSQSGGVLWNGQNESERHEYKYIHKCQSLGKVEKMTTIGKIGRMDAADTVIQWWKTSSITQLWRHFIYNGPQDQKLMSFGTHPQIVLVSTFFKTFYKPQFSYKLGCIWKSITMESALGKRKAFQAHIILNIHEHLFTSHKMKQSYVV